MDSTKNNLHPIKEWEEKVKSLPIEVEFSECKLNHGLVTKFVGTAVIDGRRREFNWNGAGKCFYKLRRVSQYDIPFNNAQ